MGTVEGTVQYITILIFLLYGQFRFTVQCNVCAAFWHCMIIYSTFRFNLVLLINQRTQEQCSIFIGGQCHKIFSYYIYIPNRGNISVCKNVCSVIDTAESSSARSVISVSQAQQCPLYRWVKLSEVLDIGDSSSAVYKFCIYFFIVFFIKLKETISHKISTLFC